MNTEELGHVDVIDWVTIPDLNNRIAVIIEKKDALVRVLAWDHNNLVWASETDWLFKTMTVPMKINDPDPRLPDAQREFVRRQIGAIYRTGWTNGEEVGDEGRE